MRDFDSTPTETDALFREAARKVLAQPQLLTEDGLGSVLKTVYAYGGNALADAAAEAAVDMGHEDVAKAILDLKVNVVNVG